MLTGNIYQFKHNRWGECPAGQGNYIYIAQYHEPQISLGGGLQSVQYIIKHPQSFMALDAEKVKVKLPQKIL